ncbi:MAG: Fpg/Nei family DNA glycosylase, partial [Anaerolineae bacterium]
DRRVLRGQSVQRVERVLSGARLREVQRRGKYLIWDLGERGLALAHLGMSGKFVLRARREPDPPAPCVVLELGSGRRVVFSDQRRLGRFQIEDGGTRQTLARIGIDALDREFTPKRFAELLAPARLSIKSFLMDQHRVAGLGNIQVAEALFHAGIHPSRTASRLSGEEIAKLHRSIRTTLKQALRRERSTEIRYLQEEDGENHFLIYGREGEPCSRCGASVRRIVQAGRSTYYCARCQPKRPRRKPGEKMPASTRKASTRGKR